MSWSPSDGSAVANDASAPTGDGVELTVPDLGDADAATIVSWTKRVGDQIANNETICRLAVGELQFEVHSTADGELQRVFAAPGGSVRSGDSLAEIGVRAASKPPATPDLEPADSKPEPERESEPKNEEPPFYVTEPPTPEVAAEPASAEEPGPAGVPDSDAWPPSPDVDWSRWHSPVVRMLAEEHGIDLSEVRGTGFGGRIRKRDLLAHLDASEHA